MNRGNYQQFLGGGVVDDRAESPDGNATDIFLGLSDICKTMALIPCPPLERGTLSAQV